MIVPFNDLRLQYQSIKEHLDQAITNTIQEFQFIKGQSVITFESNFSKQLKVNHCIATGNGTETLFSALKILNVQPGDEILTPAFSWLSSAETISLCHARPVFIDVDPVFYTMDPVKLEEKITPRTKGIVLVHLYGQAAPAQQIKEICKKHNLFLLEDCAQAHLSKDGEYYAGTVGDIGAFSFYPTKNLGAYGDAGCAITYNDELAEGLRRFSNHGALQKDDHTMEGFNSRMDTLQAAILNAKLPFLEEWNNQRKTIASLYTEKLKEISSIITPAVRPNSEHTFHLYVIRAQQRDALKNYLETKGIQTHIHFPKSLPHLPFYKNPHDYYPVAHALQNEVLSLPNYPELTISQLEYVCNTIRDFYQH